MKAQASGFISRVVAAARPVRPWLRITASPRVARLLIAAGAVPAADSADIDGSSSGQESAEHLHVDAEQLQQIQEDLRTMHREFEMPASASEDRLNDARALLEAVQMWTARGLLDTSDIEDLIRRIRIDLSKQEVSAGDQAPAFTDEQMPESGKSTEGQDN